MKCPKCGYLGFENLEQCRNCGYRFSLTESSPAVPELPLRQPDAAVESLDDFELLDAAMARADDERARVAPEKASGASSSTARPAFDPDELPLFSRAAVDDSPSVRRAAPDDSPLIRRASAPRPPLSVRRATPEVPRLRAETRTLADPSLPGLEPPPPAPLQVVRPHLVQEPAPLKVRVGPAVIQSAAISQRVVASAIDLAIVALVDVLVLYFTMQISGLLMGDIGLLPRIPLFGFLIVQNVAYFIVFTAGGQTLGKMAMGIRVIDIEQDRPPALGRSAVRTCAWIVLAMPAGLGLLTALFADDRRGLHDRVAGTRVVRAA